VILTVPIDTELYPTLGGQVCDFMEQNLVFGPGDLRGQPLVLDDERRMLIWRMYEVYPRTHPLAGRRRFKRCGLSLQKGTAKTETGALVAAVELHPEAPVRCTGWTPGGEPIGGPVTDPYIPMVAYTEEQSEDLAFGALRVILELGPLKDDFDIGLDRILRKRGDGKAVPLASAPDSRDGARTTFQHVDESHRFTTPRLLRAHQTMLANIPKRKLADAWTLETTTAPEPGTGSVAEAAMEYAEDVRIGKVKNPTFFFFHRQASDNHDLTTEDGRRAAVTEAAGPSAPWRDIDGIVSQWDDPKADKAYLERVWCNRLVKGSTQAFDVAAWKARKRTDFPVRPGGLIVLGFDGAMFHDSTGIVATDVETGFQWVPGAWECPQQLPAGKTWKVPTGEVDAKIAELFATYNVWRLYADPPYWQAWISKWIGEYGDERVIEWWTNRRRPMTAALEGYDAAMKEGHVSHDGDERLTRHIGNARRHNIGTDDQGRQLILIQKDRSDSPFKIDLAMAGSLSWEARTDAIAADALNDEGDASKDFEERGLFAS
jgi:hypothetical protein